MKTLWSIHWSSQPKSAYMSNSIPENLWTLMFPFYVEGNSVLATATSWVVTVDGVWTWVSSCVQPFPEETLSIIWTIFFFFLLFPPWSYRVRSFCSRSALPWHFLTQIILLLIKPKKLFCQKLLLINIYSGTPLRAAAQTWFHLHSNSCTETAVCLSRDFCLSLMWNSVPQTQSCFSVVN